MIIMHGGGGIGGDTGARAGVGDHSGSGGGDAAGSVHCEAGSDRRVRFLAPGIVGWDPGEKKFLGRLSLRLCQVLGENSTHSSSLWLPGQVLLKTVGPHRKPRGSPSPPLPSTASSRTMRLAPSLRMLSEDFAHSHTCACLHPSTASAHPDRNAGHPGSS